MSFFELPPPEEPEEELDVEHPEWYGPPRRMLGGAVPLRLFLARAERVVVAIDHATAFPTGLSFRLVVISRARRGDEYDVDPFGFHLGMRRPRGDTLPPELLRIGVQFADGAKATSVGRGAFGGRPDAMPDGPVLMPHGGGGGDGRWTQELWLWPLPPPGPLAFVCEWPAERIELTRVEIDAELVRAAAADAEEFWPADPRAGRR